MKRDHVENTVGPWATRKLDALEAYLRFYTTALKYQRFRLIYIDAFAGSTKSRVRGSDATVEAGPLLDDVDAEAVKQFVLGSPLRALNIQEGFDQHYFFDLDERRAETLCSLQAQYPGKAITAQVGDSNPAIQQLASDFNGYGVKGVAFLDPYGAHLEWATIEALAATKNFEVIINFPVAMAINRLITKSGDVPEGWAEQLNLCFGTEDWRTLAYQTSVDLFGNEVIMKQGNVAERLLDLYLGRLRDLFDYVATPRLIRNTRNAPLYYLIWAGPHALGLTGAEHILSEGEIVKRPPSRR